MTKARNILLVALLAVFAAGCAESLTTWSKPGANMGQATAVLKECSDTAGMLYDEKGLGDKPLAQVSHTSYSIWAGDPFETCMAGKGFKKNN